MLRLMLISPDGALYQDRQADNDRIDEIAELIQELARQGVRSALWSKNSVTIGGESLERLLSREAGVDVPLYKAGTAGLPKRQQRSSVSPILDDFQIQRCEAVLLGAKKSDLEAATNNKLLLLRPSWYEPRTEYGLDMTSVDDLRRFCLIFGLREHPVFWQVQQENLNYSAMGVYSTYIERFADVGNDAKDAAKWGGGTLDFWLSAVFATLYFANLVQDVKYICSFPGHDPSSSSPAIPFVHETLITLGQSLRVGYYRDLLVRHTASRKSQTNRGARTFSNQLDTLRLNRSPHLNRSEDPRKSKMDLRGVKVLVVDDFCTTGHSLDSARALVEAAGGEAVLFSWLKTINTPFTHMSPDPKSLKPWQPNQLAAEPASVEFGFREHIVDQKATDELDSILRRYNDW